MALRRGRNIESLLASKLEDDGSRLSDFGEQGRQARVDGRRIREYFVARGKPDDYQYSPSEAKEAMNYFKAIDRGNPFIPEEMDIEGLENRSIDEASDKQFRMDKIDDSGPAIYKQKYTNMEPDSETLDDWRTDDASERTRSMAAYKAHKSDKMMDEEYDKRLWKRSPWANEDMENDYRVMPMSEDIANYEGWLENQQLDSEGYLTGEEKPRPTSSKAYLEKAPIWDSEGESELDRVGREFMKKKIMEDNKYDDLDPQDKTDVESSFWERTKQGRVGDAFSGLFSSDDSGRDESLAQETKDNEELSGKIGAAAKLYSLLKPEQQQAAPSIPSAKISRGSIAFPGMKLASQKARRKYFTPKGLMA